MDLPGIVAILGTALKSINKNTTYESTGVRGVQQAGI